MDIKLTINPNELPPEQQQLLLCYVNGLNNKQIVERLNLSRAELATLDLDLKARLAAKTTPHAISRAWEIGLFSRVLCLALVLLAVQPVIDPVRQFRNQRRREDSAIIIDAKV